MMFSNRKIPKIASALLVFGGCSDDGGAVHGAAGVAERYCSFSQQCDPDFELEYASSAECQTEVEATVNEYQTHYAEAYGAACGQAILEYYECWAGSITGCDPESGDVFTYDDAAFELCAEAAVEACPEVFEDYDY